MSKPNTIEIVDNNPPETSNNTPKLSDKKKVIHLLGEEGLNQAEIAKALDITPARVSQVKAELKKYYVQDKKMLAKGTKIIKKIADDFLNDTGNIKDSTALRLVEMQQDRINPVIKHNLNVNANVNFTEVNLGDIK